MQPQNKYQLFLIRPLNTLGVMAVIILLLVGFMFVADLHEDYIISTALKYPGIDKVAHFITHFSLVTMLYVLLHRKLKRLTFNQCLLFMFLISFIMGVIDELQQLLFSARGFDYFDVLANLSGALSAIIFIIIQAKKSMRPALMLTIPVAVMLLVFQISTNTYKHYNMGLVHIKNKNYVEARKEFLFAINNGVELPALFNELAWIELEYMNVDPAASLSYSQKAIKAQPDNADYLDTHGWALHKNGDHQQAISYLKKAYQLDKEIYCINYHLGATFYALGRLTDSLPYLQKQLERNDKDSFAQRSRELLEKIQVKEITQLSH